MTDNAMSIFRIFLLVGALGWHGAVSALSTDREQPATIEADEVEFDFRTGVRTYTGNVIVEQGTLRITGDKLIVKYKEEAMESATAWGNPAVFRQRPDGKDADVIGEGKKILLDQNGNTLTLITNARLTQGPDTARGDVIVYDMSTDKLRIKGAATSEKKQDGKPGRSRVIITPRKQSPP